MSPRDDTDRAPLAQRALRWLWPPLTPPPPVALDPAGRDALETARAHLALARMALRGDGEVSRAHLDGASADLAALSALRESAWWTLRALDADTPVEMSAAFERHAPRVSADVMGEDLARAARGAFVERDLRGPVGDPASLRVEVARAMEFVTRLMREPLDRAADRARVWTQRVTRAVLLVAAVALVAVGVPALRRALRVDLAPGAAWRASSAQAGFAQTGVGFHPREGGANIFFQTSVEPVPWIEFDLGARREVENVAVQNRLDCCQDWAVPLVVELSNDHRAWREAGRRVEPFYFWSVLFPKQGARWVRLRVPRATSLHLGKVQIR